jgi:hypothetical protein
MLAKKFAFIESAPPLTARFFSLVRRFHAISKTQKRLIQANFDAEIGAVGI